MIKAAKVYVRYVDATSRVVGRAAMFLVFGMIGILLYEAVSRTIFNVPHIWSVELAQFVMAAYYLLGGGYTLIAGGHVRMDLFYQKWSIKKKAAVDIVTFIVLFIYLIILLIGGIQSIQYAVRYKQVTYSAWAPQVTPIKLIMVFGIFLMFLQVIAELIKDIATVRGEDLS
jgi:TRAP-type mannitol/chloroaromatic compound transport system permease small subunit